MEMSVRSLGTMVAYGFPGVDLSAELMLARQLGAAVLEILPDWGRFPDPAVVRRQAADCNLRIHSAHGCWGGQSIRAARVDLGSPEINIHRESIDDLKRSVDWLRDAGGTCLVVHPGGLSVPEELTRRRESLARGLLELGEHARRTGVVVCVENMPPGVHPGSRMSELAELLGELGHPQLALALDTGHANLMAGAAHETRAAGTLLATTHVHDNDGRQDLHLPPGHGTVNWADWGCALDEVDYRGPVLLECIRYLRHNPSHWRPEVLAGIVAALPPSPAASDRL
jgi:sugar phosphate isomerase/epimerase